MAEDALQSVSPDLLSDDEIEWTKATSKNGVVYEYGVRKSDLEGDNRDAERAAINKEEDPEPRRDVFNVNWTVQNDNYWRPTSNSGSMRISRYMLRRASNGVYQLDITNTTGWMFWFHDASGDSYFLSTPRNGDHYLRYRSQRPNIVAVSRP